VPTEGKVLQVFMLSPILTKRNLTILGGLVVLIGVGVLLFLDLPAWPWVLPVIALAGVPMGAAGGRLLPALQSGVWLACLAPLIYWDAWWPWILVPLALSSLVGTLTGSLTGTRGRSRE